MSFKELITRIDWLADKAVGFVGDNSWWLYGISVAILFVAFTIEPILSLGFNFSIVAVWLFASLIMGWIMLPIYLIPMGLVKLLCYCLLYPKDAFGKAINILLWLFAAGLLLSVLYATFHGGYE